MAELPTINLALYAQTDVGMVRSGNEDNFLILDLSTGKSWTASEEEPQELLTYTQGYYGSMLAVSDGMGGALAGEVASRMAVETVRDRMLQLQAHEVYSQMPFSERLRLAIEEANLLINGESQTNQAHKGLGATFTAVATHADQTYFAQVGDSRAYLIRQNRISRITKDQSLVQQLIDAGQITEEEAETHSYRNVILQALGAHNIVNVEVNCLSLCQYDTLVICSDGLSGKMHQEEILRIVQDANDFKSACQSLINLANERGGEDNITVVIAQFSGSGLGEPDGETVEPQTLARSPDTPTEINWGLGAKTDPLGDSTSSPDLQPIEAQLRGDGHSKATEPLPVPPTQSVPFTTKLNRTTAEIPRTNDLSDRRGPITSVFAPEDFDDGKSAAAVPDNQKQTAELEHHQTNSLAQSSTTPKPSKPDDGAGGPADSLNHRKIIVNSGVGPHGKRSSKTNLFILGGLLLLGVAGLVVGVTSYFNRQELERTAQAQVQTKLKTDNQELIEGQIGRLRERIAEINKRILQAADKPSLKEKRAAWKKSLDELSRRVDSVSQTPLEQTLQINQECDQIGNELTKIDDEVKHLLGLLPSSMANREPVKV